MSLIGFAQLLSRVSNGFKRRPAGITVKVRCGPSPKLGAALGTDRGSGTIPFDDAALHEVCSPAGRLAYAVRNTGAGGCDGRISANATWMMPPASPSATPMRQAIVYEPSAS